LRASGVRVFFARHIFLTALILALLLGSCSPAPATDMPTSILPTSTITFTPIPTIIPLTPTFAPIPTKCPGIFTTSPSPDVTVHYMECSTAIYQEEIDTAVQWATASLSDIPLGKVDVYIFDQDIATLAKLENESTMRLGYQTETVEQVKQDWGKGGGRSGADGVIFIYFGLWWRKSQYSEQVKTIVHEFHHIAQYRLSGKNNFWVSKLPVWWVEGGAEYYARTTISEHGIRPLDVTPTLRQCEQTLNDMSDWATLDQDCLYAQGSMAVKLFDNLFGQDEYWAIWKGLQYNKFDMEFETVTGISVVQFGDLFDTYRLNGYSKIPVLPAH